MAKTFDSTKINTNLFPTGNDTNIQVNNTENDTAQQKGKKKGKPYLPPDKRRTEHVNITLTKEVNEKLEKLAYNYGVSKSNYVQQLIKKDIENKKDELTD